MENSKSYELKDGFFSRTRTLVVTTQDIQFESPDLRRTARLSKNEIIDIKYDSDHIYWHLGATTRIGKKYTISIKGKERIIEVKFKSYFNTKREYSGFYSEIVQALNNYYLKDIIAGYLEKFNKDGEVQLGRIVLNTERIKVQNTGLFFLWPSLRVTVNERHFELARINEPEFRLFIDYHKWHAQILYNLITTLKPRNDSSHPPQ